jgi:hypothetical protein
MQKSLILSRNTAKKKIPTWTAFVQPMCHNSPMQNLKKHITVDAVVGGRANLAWHSNRPWRSWIRQKKNSLICTKRGRRLREGVNVQVNVLDF